MRNRPPTSKVWKCWNHKSTVANQSFSRSKLVKILHDDFCYRRLWYFQVWKGAFVHDCNVNSFLNLSCRINLSIFYYYHYLNGITMAMKFYWPLQEHEVWSKRLFEVLSEKHPCLPRLNSLRIKFTIFPFIFASTFWFNWICLLVKSAAFLVIFIFTLTFDPNKMYDH